MLRPRTTPAEQIESALTCIQKRQLLMDLRTLNWGPNYRKRGDDADIDLQADALWRSRRQNWPTREP